MTIQVPLNSDSPKNSGFVTLLRLDGDDAFIASAARVSNNLHDLSKKGELNRDLIRYLYRNQHTSPFEMVETVWHIKAPIFIARQWMRHRMASINEVSRRYVDSDPTYYTPEAFFRRPQNAKQGADESNEIESMVLRPSIDEAILGVTTTPRIAYNGNSWDCDQVYKSMIESNVAPEQARGVLPLTTYTEWYWKIDLHNLFHFLSLRLDAHAQTLIREYGQAMLDILKKKEEVKYSVEIFEEVNEIQMLTRSLMNKYKSNLGELASWFRSFSLSSLRKEDK